MPHLPPIWPHSGRAVPVTWFYFHLLWLETLTRPVWLAGRAMPGDRAVLWMKPSPMIHPSVCDPAQMLVSLPAGSVSRELVLLAEIKHTFMPGKQHKGKKSFLFRVRKLTPTQVMITPPKWSLCCTNVNQLLCGLNHSKQPTNSLLTVLPPPKLPSKIYSLHYEFNAFEVFKVILFEVEDQTKRQR